MNETEKRQIKTITTIYDAKKDKTLLKLMGWNEQYWIHQVYTTDKLEVKLINQQIKEAESKQKVARLLKRKLFIFKR
jgi:hypothetical protein